MILRVAAVTFLVSTILVIGRSKTAQSLSERPPAGLDHVTWVAQSLRRMETIKSGMTRQQLLTVFTGEGGLSTGLQRTFVSQDCPYFKIDVTFRAVGRPKRDGNGRTTLIEDPRDVIVSLSRPYLQFSIMN